MEKPHIHLHAGLAENVAAKIHFHLQIPLHVAFLALLESEKYEKKKQRGIEKKRGKERKVGERGKKREARNQD